MQGRNKSKDIRLESSLFTMLQSGSAELGLQISEQTIQKMVWYIDMLLKWNKIYNLTALTCPKDIVTHHLLDSLSIVPYIHGERLLDIGSGAGLPGIPCSLAMPQMHVVMLDSNGKKTRFITQVIGELAISNASVVQARVENYHTSSCFDVVTARAFSSIKTTLKLAERFLCPEGRLLIMKGSYPQAQLQKIGNHAKVYPLSVPYLNKERHLVSIERVFNE
jgi:16S rRNA (guanine527-N7)-methyltransferase